MNESNRHDPYSHDEGKCGNTTENGHKKALKWRSITATDLLRCDFRILQLKPSGAPPARSGLRCSVVANSAKVSMHLNVRRENRHDPMQPAFRHARV